MTRAPKPPTERQLAMKAKKEAKAKAVAQALDAAQEALRPPPELGGAGVIKTRAWVALHAKLTKATKLKHPSVERIGDLTRCMLEWPRMDAPRAAQVCEMLKGGAA